MTRPMNSSLSFWVDCFQCGQRYCQKNILPLRCGVCCSADISVAILLRELSDKEVEQIKNILNRKTFEGWSE